jgi:3-phenylpropionate/trans-cinnamate dioxygenase ferredoxin reductase subunit
MTAPRTLLIVGGGLAAAEAAKTLRAEGYDDRLVVVTEEPRAPYERPPLTKAYLRGEVDANTLHPVPADFYADGGIDLRTSTRATELDVHDRRVRFDDGSDVVFDGLLLATGARAFRPALKGIEQPWVHLLRKVEDADRLRDAAHASATAVVAGGGWIAAETAASLSQMGLAVTLVIPGTEVLEHHLGSTVARRFSELHERHGVRLVRAARVTEVVDRGIRTADGARIEGDIVVLGFGVSPATELAERAGLELDHGVVADERLETSAPAVFVAGDVATAWHPRYGIGLRSSHWDNARRQGRTAARNLLGRGEVYDRVPYFFSDQFELGMELIGRPETDADVWIRPEGDGYVALWVRDGTAVAGMHADAWDTKRAINAIVEGGAPVERAAFEDSAVPLGEVAGATAVVAG